jgi:hypothetical protein
MDGISVFNFDYRLSTIDYRLPITDYRPSKSGHRTPKIEHRDLLKRFIRKLLYCTFINFGFPY